MSNKIIAHFTGPENTGKTNLEVAFAKFCQLHGVAVSLPPDPQRDEKMGLSIEELMRRVAEKGASVMVIETQAARQRA